MNCNNCAECPFLKTFLCTVCLEKRKHSERPRTTTERNGKKLIFLNIELRKSTVILNANQ